MAALALSTAASAPAATITVTNNADSGAGTLRAAIAAANNGDTVRINLQGIINLTSEEIVIDKSLNIVGLGASVLTISGNNARRIFAIEPGVQVAITGITFTNGLSTDPASGGGAIRLFNSTLTVSGCTFENNHANQLGGGAILVHAQGGEARLNLIACDFTGNTSGLHGGAMLCIGETAMAFTQITQCTFIDNNAFFGGAIANRATGESGKAVLHVARSSFSGNDATLLGGAIDNIAETNGDFPEFVTATVTLAQVTIEGGEALVGGGLANTANNGTTAHALLASTIISNHQTIDDGGGVANLSISGGQARLEIINSVIENNTAQARGGGLINSASAGAGLAHALVVASTINNNQADDGAGIFNNAEGNGVATLEVRSSTIHSNSADDSGGGIANHSAIGSTANLSVLNSTLSGNEADAGGGVFNFTSGGTSNAVIEHSTFSNNTGFGASVANAGGGANVTLSHNILNASLNSISNVNGTITSLGHNLTADAAGGDANTGPGGLLNAAGDIRNTEPFLTGLQDHGGATLTHGLHPWSPAIDAGDPELTALPLTDQRGSGLRRRAGDAPDIGAFEFQSGGRGCRAGNLSFWRRNPQLWPTDELVIGGQTYTQEQMVAILSTSPGRNATARLLRAVIPARLNILNGSPALAVSETLARAESLLASADVDAVDARTPLGKQMVREAKLLQRWRPLAMCAR